MRDGWTETTLNQVLLSVTTRAKDNSDYEVLSVTERRGIIPQTEVFNHRIATDDISKYKVLQPGDIAFNPYLLWCGAVGQWKGNYEGVVSPVYECFRVRETDSPRFVGLIFESGVLTPYFDSTAIGSIVRRRRTTLPVFYEAPIFRPPLAEQKRIVDVVSSVDVYIDALQQQVDMARKARNAVLHELLSAGGDDWTETTVSSLLSRSIGGVWGTEPGTDQEEVTVVRSTEFTKSGILSFATGVPRSIKSSQLSSRALIEGDILLEKSGGGPEQPVGRVVYVQSDIPPRFVCSNFIQLLTPIQQKVLPKFLFLVMWHWHFENKTLEYQAQTTGIRNLRTPDYLEQFIALPPLAEQKRIVGIMSTMDDVIQSTEQAVVDARNLRSGLLSDLLSGEHEIPASYDSLLGAA
jgi:type I restriction enzyme S subunit